MLRTLCLLVLLLASSCFAATFYVNVTATAFVPQSLSIQEGDIVVWNWNNGAGCHNVIETGASTYPPSCASVVAPVFCSANSTFPESCTVSSPTDCLDGNTFSFRFFLSFGVQQKTFVYISAPNCASGMYGRVTVSYIAPTQPILPGTPAPTCSGDCGGKSNKRSPWVWAGIALIGLVLVILVVIFIMIIVKCCGNDDGNHKNRR